MNAACRLLLVLLALLPVVDAASAEDLPAAEMCDSAIQKDGGPCLEGSEHSFDGILEERHRNVLGFVVGKSDFVTAKRIFGDAELWGSGDAASAEHKVCYLAGDREAVVSIIVSSNDEMSGGAVDGLRIVRGRPSFENKCARTTLDPSKVQTRSGIHLGMSADELKSILGAPSGTKAGLSFYTYCKETELRPDDKQYKSCLSEGKSVETQCSGVTARFDEGGLKWIEIGFGGGTC